jgi:hypothetical protein
MIPVIANHRPLRHLLFLLACRPPHPSAHSSRQFPAARIAIVLFRMHRGRSARSSDPHLRANRPHPSSRPGMIRLNRPSKSPYCLRHRRELAALPPHHLPTRFRALALFGRRPSYRVVRSSLPASENLVWGLSVSRTKVAMHWSFCHVTRLHCGNGYSLARLR